MRCLLLLLSEKEEVGLIWTVGFEEVTTPPPVLGFFEKRLWKKPPIPVCA